MNKSFSRDALPMEREPLFVCRACGRIYGDIVGKIRGTSRPGQRQTCDCRSTDCGAACWSDYDFPEAVTLCRCCGRRALLSGSRWSIWFCAECHRAVQAIHRASRSRFIPVGRHTLFSRDDLAQEAENPDVPKFIAELGDWFMRVERLERQAAAIVQSNLCRLLDEFPADVPLDAYLERLSPTAAELQTAIHDLGRAFNVPSVLMPDPEPDMP